MINDLGRNLFPSLLTELVVVILAIFFKEDKKKMAVVLAIGTIFAGLMSYIPWNLGGGGHPTPIPLANPSPTPPTLSGKNAPVILGVQTRKSTTSAGLVVYADIHFQDQDGDSYIVTYNLISSTVPVQNVDSDPISANAESQMAGTIVTARWDCEGRGYTVTVNATILDQAGNQSNSFPITFDCN